MSGFGDNGWTFRAVRQMLLDPSAFTLAERTFDERSEY